MPFLSLNAREACPDRVTADFRDPSHLNRGVGWNPSGTLVGIPSELATARFLRETMKSRYPTTREVSPRSLSSALMKEGHEDGM